MANTGSCAPCYELPLPQPQMQESSGMHNMSVEPFTTLTTLRSACKYCMRVCGL